MAEYTPTIADLKEAYVQFCTWKREPTCGRVQAETEFEAAMTDERAKRPDREHLRTVAEQRYDYLSPRPRAESIDDFMAGVDVVLAELAELALEPDAREEPKAPKIENLEIIGGWLVERGVHPGEYPAGAAYGMLPDSDAEPLMDLSKIPGWPEAREVTDLKAELLKLASEESWCGECTLADDVEKLLLSADEYAALISDREEARRKARR